MKRVILSMIVFLGILNITTVMAQDEESRSQIFGIAGVSSGFPTALYSGVKVIKTADLSAEIRLGEAQTRDLYGHIGLTKNGPSIGSSPIHLGWTAFWAGSEDTELAAGPRLSFFSYSGRQKAAYFEAGISTYAGGSLLNKLGSKIQLTAGGTLNLLYSQDLFLVGPGSELGFSFTAGLSHTVRASHRPRTDFFIGFGLQL